MSISTVASLWLLVVIVIYVTPSSSTLFVFDNSTTITTICSSPVTPCALTDRRLWGEGENANTSQPIIIQGDDSVVIISIDNPVFILIDSSVNMADLYVDIPEGELQVDISNSNREGLLLLDPLSLNVLGTAFVSSNFYINSNAIVVVKDLVFVGQQMIMQQLSSFNVIYSFNSQSLHSSILVKDDSLLLAGSVSLQHLKVIDNATFKQKSAEYSYIEGFQTAGNALVSWITLELRGQSNLFGSTIPVYSQDVEIAIDSSAYFTKGLDLQRLTLSANTYVQIEDIFKTTGLGFIEGSNATISVVNSDVDVSTVCALEHDIPLSLLFSDSTVKLNSCYQPQAINYSEPKVSFVRSEVNLNGTFDSITSDNDTTISVSGDLYINHVSHIEGKLSLYNVSTLDVSESLKVGNCDFREAESVSMIIESASVFVCDDAFDSEFWYLYMVKGSFLHYGLPNVVSREMICKYSATINNTVNFTQTFRMCSQSMTVNGDMHLGHNSSVMFPVTGLLTVSGNLYIGNEVKLTLSGDSVKNQNDKLVIIKASKIIGSFSQVFQSGSVVENALRIYYTGKEIYFERPPPPTPKAWEIWLKIAAGFTIGLCIYGIAIGVGLLLEKRKRNLYLEIND